MQERTEQEFRSFVGLVAQKLQEGHHPKAIIARLRLSLYMPNLTMRQIEDLMCDINIQWEKHPQYENYRKFYGWDKRPPHPAEDFWSNSVCLGVFEHEPGKEGRTESFIVCSPPSVFGQIKWARRTWDAEFKCLRPLPIDYFLPFYSRIGWISNSYKGAGGAAENRHRLKQLLPKEIKPWIANARRLNKRKKKWMVEQLVGKEEFEKWNPPFVGDPNAPDIEGVHHQRTKTARYSRKWKYPPPYDKRTKREIFLYEEMPSEIRQLIQQYMSLEDFFDHATGKAHPDELYTKIGLPLFSGSQLPVPEIPLLEQKKAKDEYERPVGKRKSCPTHHQPELIAAAEAIITYLKQDMDTVSDPRLTFMPEGEVSATAVGRPRQGDPDHLNLF